MQTAAVRLAATGGPAGDPDAAAQGELAGGEELAGADDVSAFVDSADLLLQPGGGLLQVGWGGGGAAVWALQQVIMLRGRQPAVHRVITALRNPPLVPLPRRWPTMPSPAPRSVCCRRSSRGGRWWER